MERLGALACSSRVRNNQDNKKTWSYLQNKIKLTTDNGMYFLNRLEIVSLNLST